MKLICNTAAITEACTNVQRAVASKSVNPALEGIYMKTTDHGVEICGYDTEVGITTMIETGSPFNGSIVINAKMLCDILRHLPDQNMTLEANEKYKCVIKSGDAQYTIMGMSDSEYPELPYVMGGSPVVLPQELLKDMIREVIFAVSTDDSKTVHKGVKFEISDNQIKLVALDGYRLAVRKENIDYSGDPITFIVPSKTLSEVVKLINDEDGFVSIHLDKSHIVFGLNGYSIVSRLLEGDFLNYGNAIPKQFETTVTVSTRDFVESIDRMSLLITEKFKTPLKCIFDDNSIRFISNTTIGSANDKINAEIDGGRVEKGFNSRYLAEAFRAIDSDKAVIMLNAAAVSPACIVPIEGDSFFYMVLPVRLPDEK